MIGNDLFPERASKILTNINCDFLIDSSTSKSQFAFFNESIFIIYFTFVLIFLMDGF